LLEQQIQLMRATFQLNQEKLEYNFQVLKKRDEENTITKSQQKRKITRLQDVMNTLRIKLAKQEKQFRDENSQLTEDYKRITEQFMELQKKSRHFITTDNKKFTDIWIMNEAEAKELVEKVCEQDRIVTEHQLGLRWDQPDLEFMDNVGPILSEQTKRQQVSATQVVQEVMSQTGGVSDQPVADPVDRPYRPEPGEEEEGSEYHHGSMLKDPATKSEQGETVKSTITQKFSAHTIKKILELLCDESGFLVENKLVKLLAPLEQDEQSLMKLDAIFAALGVETEDDIYRLSNFFTKFRQATERAQSGQGSRKQSVVEVERQDGEPEKEGEEGTQTDEMAEDAEVAEELQKVMEDGEEVVTPRSVKSEVTELIHPNDVYKALRVFVEEQWQPTKEKSKQPQFKIANTEDRDDADDAAYWKKYCSILPEKTERMWDALLDGLEMYSDCLQSRAKLITETDGLRQQNAELRMLLHQYVNSKVNAELEIPPTRVLNLEFQQA
ncbi:dynein regulatory complex protein 1-like, partial [Lingula anatina]|uniref:Dynein regulatory complex protein 1-like n=1 Tax=Lingula anatina TaxID=7574 RepID=A0A1S3H4B2_LINAN